LTHSKSISIIENNISVFKHFQWDYYYKQDATHFKNYNFFMGEIMNMSWPWYNLKFIRGLKFTQIDFVFHILLHEKPMLEYELYELLREFLLLLKFNNTHQNISQDTNGWQIVKTVHHCMIVVLSNALSIVSKVNYVVISVDEMTNVRGSGSLWCS
jgi:hypothetical protein